MKYESLEINDEIRALQSGNFINISDGSVYYELGGPQDGKVIVLVHGLTTPSFVWDPTFNTLIKEGYRVLRYDLFGRGYSDRPKIKYTKDLYDRQLYEMLIDLKLTDQPISMIGLSFGGAVCANFAVNHTKLVKEICLIDPVYSSTTSKSLNLLKIPLLRSIILKIAGIKILISGQSKVFFKDDYFPVYQQKFSEQLKYKGYKQAIISTLINNDFNKFPEIYKQVGKLNLPVCLFWGENDKVIPYETHKKLLEAIPDLTFHSIKEAGHMSHYERHDIVNPLLLEFLKE